MKIQTFGFIFFSAVGLVRGLAIKADSQDHGHLVERNNWGKSSTTPYHPHPTPGHKDEGKDCDGDKKPGQDGKGKDGKGGGDKGKDPKGNEGDDPNEVDPPIDLPPDGVPINKPFPQFDTTPPVPPNQPGDIDGTSMEEDDPRVVLVGTYIERLARQTAPIRIPFAGDEGPIYDEQNAVDILDDYYCIDEITGNPDVDYNCTANFGVPGGQPHPRDNRYSKRAEEYGTYALAVPQIYRWRTNSRITLVVPRNTKRIWMNLNQGIDGATPAWVRVRASEITAAAMSKAYRYWNRADVGVRFAWSRDLARSTYVVRTGGSKGAALATADYPAQPVGYQHLVSAWDSMLESVWHPVGPNILSHELGHALGLEHNDETEDVYELWDGTGETIMNSAVSSDVNVITAIPERDADGTRILYEDLNPPVTNRRTVIVLRAPQGPVPAPIVFNRPKCRLSGFGGCIYY